MYGWFTVCGAPFSCRKHNYSTSFRLINNVYIHYHPLRLLQLFLLPHPAQSMSYLCFVNLFLNSNILSILTISNQQMEPILLNHDL